MSYEITWLENTLVIKLTGHVSVSDLHEVNQQTLENAHFGDIRKRVINCLEVDTAELCQSDLKILAAMEMASAATNPHIDSAFICRSDPIRHLTEDYINACHQLPWKVELFESLNDAFQWQP
ncbi:hypothetical protein [Oceanicoccus sagamiensis]|uniref:STAS/SEC14 domain-containing protein n=1 Tax=Oceanicoccus sagamiensis TaxID=716816 RepID=A0A1X9NAP8_9GAMM|nr:hypothetical protein [Oceanicoccus sagamiensis]ARN75120.1 hypothetical protein BST96_13950 [Oceanicoccus sagamiensis]